MKRNRKIIFLFSLIFVFSFTFVTFVEIRENLVADVYTSAKSMCVMEAGSKRILYQKNSEQKLPMASTTKIMTAITAIESGVDLDDVFEISPKAIGVPGTSLYLREGEKLTLRKLLYGLMLVSGNDAKMMFKDGGYQKQFAKAVAESAKAAATALRSK